VPGPVALEIDRQVGSLQKGTELCRTYSTQSRDELMAGVISEDWPIWLSILPALGIKRAVSWGTQHCLKWNTYFAGEMPGLQFISSKEKLMKKKLDVVFVSGSPGFVKEICSALEGHIIWATCPAQRGKRLGALGQTDLR
jgi:hypothetical protein